MYKDCRICVHNAEDIKIVDYYRFDINDEMIGFYLKNSKDKHAKYDKNKSWIISYIAMSFGSGNDSGGYAFGDDHFELGYFLNETQRERIKCDIDAFNTFFSDCNYKYSPLFERREVRTTKAFIASVK